ncbi:hypothetical protein [Bdellovibrio sp. HCB337]|uniref:hypothetical protein n=1 Tax=Bdellovibrio sp. HCB337 TaxID=3394358 RepID=UPI0039A5E099
MKNLFAVLLIFTSLSTYGAGVTETHNNVRSAGMGGIYMSIVNNSEALFVNPAALGRTQGLNWQVMNVETGVNGMDIYEDFRDIDTSDPNSFNQFFGKDIWFRLGGKAAVTLPYFGVGVYTDNQTQLELHNPAFPQFDTTFISDYGVVVGGSFPIAPNTYGGLTLKRITRWGGQQDIDLGVIAGGDMDAIADQFQNKGNAYGIDAAVMTSLPLPLNPTFSVVWQDVGSTAFQMTDGADAPPRIHDNLSAGISTSLDLPGLDWTAGFEYRHITESQYQLGKKLHFGTEFSLPFIDIRGGINQGYAAYGVGMNLFFLRFDVASYKEEMGAYPGQSPQNRIELGLSMDLSFDADFRLVGADGKRRKLKQRR